MRGPYGTLKPRSPPLTIGRGFLFFQNRTDLAIYKYHCLDCGPVDAMAISLKPHEADPAA
jgi:hypothetical protein